MNHLAQTREWPTLKLSRWQIIQLSLLSVLIAGMVFWKVQYEQIVPRMNPVQMMMQNAGSLHGQSFTHTSVSNPEVVKSQL